jgi:hypothetical protein
MNPFCQACLNLEIDGFWFWCRNSGFSVGDIPDDPGFCRFLTHGFGWGVGSLNGIGGLLASGRVSYGHRNERDGKKNGD